jgi:hypothetical protein
VSDVTAAACAELAQLTPMLAPALRRDTTGSGRYGRLEPTLTLYNGDVLAVRIMLLHHVPATAMRACQLVNEPWPTTGRTYGACLTGIPRWHDRLHVLGRATGYREDSNGRVLACCHLDTITRHWVRQAKRALRLLTPDLALTDSAGTPTTCPECLLGDPPHGQLYMAGSEAFINTGKPGPPLTWVTSGRVYCSREKCEAYWTRTEWGLLEKMIRDSRKHAQGPTSLPEHAPDVAC